MILALILAALTLIAVSLAKTYYAVPLRELKRQARDGDEFSALLYKASAHGANLHLLLWAIVGVSAAGFFVIFSRSSSAWLAFFGAVALTWFGFAWLPAGRVTFVGKFLARVATPLISWLLQILHPLLSWLTDLSSRYRPVNVHTGLYDREDLVNLLRHQRHQGGRIDTASIDATIGALNFGEQLVRDHMTPKRLVKFVSQDDPIGPVLLDELHKSGFSRFPVTGEEEATVGTLYLHDLAENLDGRKVNSVMDKTVYFVHEEETLHKLLKAFLKTRHHLFVVVNSFEEVVGVITIEDVLEQIIGKEIVDEFDAHEDLRAVAHKFAEKEHETNTEVS